MHIELHLPNRETYHSFLNRVVLDPGTDADMHRRFLGSGFGTNETLERCYDIVHINPRSFPSEGPTVLQAHIVSW